MFPTSSSTFLVGRNVRSATALIKLALSSPRRPSIAMGDCAGKPTPPGRAMTNPQPAALTDSKPRVRERFQLVCSAALDAVEDEELRGGGRDRGDRRADRLRRRASDQERIRAQREFPGAGRRRRRSRPRSAWPSTPTWRSLSATRPQDDPERRGHDLQRHLRVPGAQGRGHRRRGVRRDLEQANLASPSRPIWIVDQPPGPVPVTVCKAGGPGGAVTAYSNTWALGQLKPGATAKFDGPSRRSSPAGTSSPGRSRPASTARPRRSWPTDRRRSGTFKVTVQSRPAQSYVTDIGQGRRQAVAPAAAGAVQLRVAGLRPRC